MKLGNNSIEEIKFATSDIIAISLLLICIAAIIRVTILSLVVLVPVLAVFIAVLIKEKFLSNSIQK